MTKQLETTSDQELKDLIPKHKNSLSEYIEENSKLISVLGVFTALTVFTYGLPIKPLGYALSFVFLSISVVVWIELWTKFPPEPSSWRLVLFENILSYSILGIIVYWLLAYREIWRIILVFPIWMILVSIIGYPLSKYKIFNKIAGYKIAKYQVVRILFGLVLLLFVTIIAGLIAIKLSPWINHGLDEMRNGIDKLMDKK